MFPINLPAAKLKIKEEEGQTFVFDIIRKKYLVLTPEEWVRQHVLHLLIDQYHYPKGLIKLEKGHVFNERQKRTDLLVYDNAGKVNLLVECKAHSEPINQTTLTQALRYNLHYGSHYLFITNGITSFCFDCSQGDKTIQLANLPVYKPK
jgi:predicted type IV restriction endonuclease